MGEKWGGRLAKNLTLYRAVTKGQGLGTSLDYYEHNPGLLWGETEKKKYKQQPKEFLGSSNSPLTYYIYLANLSDSSVYGRADNIKFKVSWYVANVSHALS